MAGERISLGECWRARRVAREVQAWLAEDPQRVFHGHSRSGLLVAMWLAWCGERRVLASVHCYGRQRWFYRLAEKVLAGRVYWLTPAMRGYYGVGERGWDNCVPPCIAGEWAAEVQRPRSAKLRLGGAGALIEWKGWHVVLEALAALPTEVRERVSFEHIGAADPTPESQAYARRLRADVERLGLVGQVDWRGMEPDSSRLLGEVDVVLVPSCEEPFSMIMLEALRRGVPVIAAAAGGPQDVIRPPVNGWLFKSGDARALAGVIARVAQPEAWGDVRIDVAQLQRFSTERVAAQWVDVYRKLAAG